MLVQASHKYLFALTSLILLVLALPTTVNSHYITDAEIVHVDQDGFHPTTVAIEAGSAIAFENLSTENHHPIMVGDQPYFEIDPISPGETIKINFNDVGVYSYVDKLNTNAQGFIIVTQPGSDAGANKFAFDFQSFWDSIIRFFGIEKTPEQDIEGVNFEYSPPIKDVQISEAYTTALTGFTCLGDDFTCLSKFITEFTQNHGATKALTIVDWLVRDGYIQEFAIDTHLLSHYIGIATAEYNGVNHRSFSGCTAEQLYACMHGFLIYAYPRINDLNTIMERTCEPIRLDTNSTVNDVNGCYHGMGHAVMEVLGNDLDQSIEVCEAIPGGHDASAGCYQGAFMEAVSDATNGYGVPDGIFNEQDPMAPCNKYHQDSNKSYQCYLNQHGWLMKLYENNFQQVLDTCVALIDDNQNRSGCLHGAGLLTSSPGWYDILPIDTELSVAKNAWDLCLMAPKSGQLDCMYGAQGNIHNFDDFDTYPMTRDFCLAAPDYLKSECYNTLGNRLYLEKKSNAEKQSICGMIYEIDFLDHCLEGSRLLI